MSKNNHEVLPAKHEPNGLKRLSANVLCGYCGKSFAWKSNLQRHILSVHEQKTDTNQKNYECEICSRKFSKKFNLDRHISWHRKYKNLKSNETKQSIQCCMCSYTSHLKTALLEHYKTCHRYEVFVEKLKFKDITEFELWKEGIEKSDVSKYVLQQSRKQTDTNFLQYYHCHRDGFYKKSGKNIRRLKLTGSIKINTYCPSKMNVTVSKLTGEVSVKFLRQHLGHKMELEKIPLSKKTQDTLAEKLKQKIPFDEVLNDVRDNVVVENLDRVHLLTRQDLFNIERKYNLGNDSVRHSINCNNVGSWVEKARQSSYNSVVRFYKEQGEKSSMYDELKSDDFLLLIMNEAQLDVFKKYGNNCVCVDTTHGLNPYDYELITVMVPDELGEGFPCLFAFTNRNDATICKIIFEVLKNNLGDSQVTPIVFMSEMADGYYDAWKAVMGPVNSKLFCTWHVNEAWKKNIQSKISNTEAQEYASKTLSTLLEEQDPTVFEDMLEKWMTDLCDPEMEEFGEYFKTVYAPTRKSWANCFRLRAGLNISIHFERMHMSLEYIYSKGRTAERLDKAIHAIMRLVREKLFERLMILNKGKVCGKLKDLQKRHKNMESLVAKKTQVVKGDGTFWSVLSSNDVELYRIELSRKTCSCDFKCDECETCIHKYICSCIDSSIKWNMCKHIHLLCQHLKGSADMRTEEQVTNFERWPVDGDQSVLVIFEEIGGSLGEIGENFLQTSTIEVRKETIEVRNDDVEVLNDTIEVCDKAIEVRKEAIEVLKDAIEAHSEAIEVHSEAIEVHNEAIEVHNKAIEAHNKAIVVRKSAILNNIKSILARVTTHEECDVLEQLLIPVQSTFEALQDSSEFGK